ncbi:MAG TPA: peptidase M29 [Burkholderiales bacterium]|nr:peptidase M29 [Burkholderiales bacterium]
MLVERIEGKWIEAFKDVFRQCAVKPGEVVAILSESQSRPVLAELSELALQALGARVFHVRLPSPPVSGVPIRSTGTSLAVGGLEPVVAALAGTGMVVDCTVEGMLHAPELPRILAGGTRLMMISNEHPEVLERTKPTPELRDRVIRGIKVLRQSKLMKVSSPHGTNLAIKVESAAVRGATGIVDKPKGVGYWPAGLCLCFPKPGSVNGRLVLAPGDVNLTFKRYFEAPVTLVIENDYVARIEGDGLDAALLRSYYEAWNDREAYATSHVGWGMNTDARPESMMMYDRAQINGTELRAFGGNFLYSTGANETANRFTACHFDFPMRECTVELDGVKVVDKGKLSKEML